MTPSPHVIRCQHISLMPPALNRTVRDLSLFFDGGLVRMEEERPGVRCRHGVESAGRRHGFFLEDAERTLGIRSEIEIRVAV